MVILVTRSIALSNTQYSLLLEAEGKFLILGSEWIGSLAKYKQESRCYSKLYSDNDLNYTDILGVNNDECEYFCNGAIQNERFYIQSYVFDAAFEVKLDFERIEVDFVQQNATEKMPVTSNPFFAFHDDVFPAFSKNAASQSRFPKPAVSLFGPLKKTIIPDDYFNLPEDFLHISSFELDFNQTSSLKFQLDFEVKLMNLIFLIKKKRVLVTKQQK